MSIITTQVEDMVIGLYDTGEIGFVEPPSEDAEVVNLEYPEEVFIQLKSGRRSPHYVNGRNIGSYAHVGLTPPEFQKEVRDMVMTNFCAMLDQHAGKYHHLLGLPEAMTSMTGAIGERHGDSVLWMRAMDGGNKKYGLHELIQGRFESGDRVLVLDNVVTDSASKLQAAEPIEASGLRVVAFGVLIDREEGGREALEQAGYDLYSIVGMSAVINILAANGRINSQQKEWADVYRAKVLESLQK